MAKCIQYHEYFKTDTSEIGFQHDNIHMYQQTLQLNDIEMAAFFSSGSEQFISQVHYNIMFFENP